MQGIEISSLFIDSLREIGIGLIVILGIYFSMSILDTEDSSNSFIPLINLSFCSIGFAVMLLLFVHFPSWLGANSLSWLWMSSFAVAWAFGSASLGVSRLILYVLSYYALFQSQLSTDTRALGIKALSQPQSVAITMISLLTGLLLLFGSRCGIKLLESRNQQTTFSLLLLSAWLGLCIGEMLYLINAKTKCDRCIIIQLKRTVEISLWC